MESTISSYQKLAIIERNSSIELQRILSACAVIVLHYNGIGHVLDFSSGISKEIMTILECLCVCAVDVFIMISGFFLYTTQKRTWDKPLYLFLTLFYINVTGYVSTCLMDGGGDFKLFTLVHGTIPPKNYFVVLYITLYIISPYINIAINKLSRKLFLSFICTVFILFSIYPTLMDTYQNILHSQVMGVSTIGAWGQQHGYTIVNFSLCYCFGAMLRKGDLMISKPKRKYSLSIIVSVACIYLSYKVGLFCSNNSQTLVESNALSYSNPFVIILSYSSLGLFSQMSFHSRIINILAKAAFVCYLTNLVVLPQLNIGKYAEIGGISLLLHLLASIISIYLLSFILWFILNILTKKITRRFSRYLINTIQ